MRLCGIKFGHDGSVALIEGDTLVFSVELEKLSNNMRHAALFDLAAVEAILNAYGYAFKDVDRFVVDGWHPRKDIFQWGEREVHLPRAPYIQTPLNRDMLEATSRDDAAIPYVTYPHYAGHALGAYCSSPFAESRESAYVLSWDGGMVPYMYYFDATSGRFANVGPLSSIVGDLYADMAAGLGPFSPNPNQWETLGTPGKIMAYVAYGTEREALMSVLKDASARLPQLEDGNIRDIYGMNQDYLRYIKGTEEFAATDGDDAIASYHGFVQRMLLESLEKITAANPGYTRNLCYAGGCALNIKWNQAIRRSGMFEAVWIPPFPNDAGSALGTACCAMVALTGAMALKWNVYSGPPFQVPAGIVGWDARACSMAELAELIHTSNEPILFLDGKAELGPRALGNRSILAAASGGAMKDTLNRVKGREGYRPVAPICLESHAPDIFDPGSPDPFMLYDHHVRPAWKEKIPAIQHLDGTARLQTVNAGEHPLIFELLTAYHAISGIPLLCNTSANFQGKGFFPDLGSATGWGKVNYVWSAGRLFLRQDKVTLDSSGVTLG
jgi:carbamoyltransferase